MNERIQDLSMQARKYAQQYVNESVIPYGKTASEFQRIFESKFAELIVEECSYIVENSPWRLKRGYKAIDQSNLVKQHFGVES